MFQTRLIQSDSGAETVFYVKRHVDWQMLSNVDVLQSFFVLIHERSIRSVVIEVIIKLSESAYLFLKDSNFCPFACMLSCFFSLVLPLFIHLSISPHSPGGFDCSLAPCEEEQMQIETPSHKHMH